MRKILFSFLLVAGISSHAQTLFTYGTHPVDKNEFWRAFSKNNNGATDEKSIREYLDLFVRFKLKVQAAKDAKLDTLPNIKNDIAAFRAQVIEQYMRNQGSNKEMVNEAIDRSITEFEVAHVFVGYDNDSAKAKATIDKAYAQLQSGADFSATAKTMSTNDYVQSTNGYIGFISVFSLPYDLENAVYNTAAGSYSKPVAGKSGYHIFKVLSKRASTGKMKAAQILIAMPANATQEEIAAARSKAEMVYGLAKKGEDFGKLAQSYSDDKLTYANGGELPEFGFTKYDPAFSKIAFGLQNDGDISTPVQTASGFHIIKRLALKPAVADKTDPALVQEYSEKVNADPRMTVVAVRQKEQIRKNSQYKVFPYKEAELWTVTDTMLKSKNYVSFYKANQQKPLFQLGTQKIFISDWLKWVKNLQSPTYSPPKTEFKNLLQQFTDLTAEQYYKDRLELTNEDVRYQVKEFREGSMLFEIMERKIWSLAPTDSAGLLNFYTRNKQKYTWQPSVNAIIFNCADSAVANRAMEMMRKEPLKWKEHMDHLGGTALADSSRFELNQLPVPQGTVFTAGQFTPVVTNTNDGSSSFCYILNVFNSKDQRSFEEAKGLVINDYQLFLEDKWITELKKKYPVKVNEGVLKSMVK
nr:peptidylprolyl isomerase [uncultured Lacibacter sp.]